MALIFIIIIIIVITIVVVILSRLLFIRFVKYFLTLLIIASVSFLWLIFASGVNLLLLAAFIIAYAFLALLAIDSQDLIAGISLPFVFTVVLLRRGVVVRV